MSVIPSSTVCIVDDEDKPQVLYEGKWSRRGCTNSCFVNGKNNANINDLGMHTTNTPGSSVTVEFYGDSIVAYGGTLASADATVISCIFDGSEPATLGVTASGQDAFQVRLCAVSEVALGNHTFQIRYESGPTFQLDYFLFTIPTLTGPIPPTESNSTSSSDTSQITTTSLTNSTCKSVHQETIAVAASLGSIILVQTLAILVWVFYRRNSKRRQGIHHPLQDQSEVNQVPNNRVVPFTGVYDTSSDGGTTCELSYTQAGHPQQSIAYKRPQAAPPPY